MTFVEVRHHTAEMGEARVGALPHLQDLELGSDELSQLQRLIQRHRNSPPPDPSGPKPADTDEARPGSPSALPRSSVTGPLAGALKLERPATALLSPTAQKNLHAFRELDMLAFEFASAPHPDPTTHDPDPSDPSEKPGEPLKV